MRDEKARYLEKCRTELSYNAQGQGLPYFGTFLTLCRDPQWVPFVLAAMAAGPAPQIVTRALLLQAVLRGAIAVHQPACPPEPLVAKRVEAAKVAAHVA